MVGNTNQALYAMLDGKNKEITDPPLSGPALTPETDPANWYQYAHPESVNASSNPIADVLFPHSVSETTSPTFIAETPGIFSIKQQSSVLIPAGPFKADCAMAILFGPLVFGLSIFDGFQHTLRQWLARYVNVFMWLPVANIFGAITAKIQLIGDAAGTGGETGYTDSFFQDTNTGLTSSFLVIADRGLFSPCVRLPVISFMQEVMPCSEKLRLSPPPRFQP